MGTFFHFINQPPVPDIKIIYESINFLIPNSLQLQSLCGIQYNPAAHSLQNELMFEPLRKYLKG